MDIDLDLYRHEVRVSTNPLVRLSAIDISPDHPQRTFVFIHGFGGQAESNGSTSLSRQEASPAQLLSIRRAHWGIETGLHYRRDVTLHEDATRMTVRNTGKLMASINNLVLALIRQAGFHNAAQARRRLAAHLSDAVALLTTPFSRF